MDLRKDFGGKLEKIVFGLIDQAVDQISSDTVKKDIHDFTDKFIDKYSGIVKTYLSGKLKAQVDKTDGEIDSNVDGTTKVETASGSAV